MVKWDFVILRVRSSLRANAARHRRVGPEERALPRIPWPHRRRPGRGIRRAIFSTWHSNTYVANRLYTALLVYGIWLGGSLTLGSYINYSTQGILKAIDTLRYSQDGPPSSGNDSS